MTASRGKTTSKNVVMFAHLEYFAAHCWVFRISLHNLLTYSFQFSIFLVLTELFMMKISQFGVRIDQNSDNSSVKWIISLGSNLIGPFRGLKFSSVSLMDVLKNKKKYFVALIFSWFGGMSNCSNHSRKKERSNSWNGL